MKKMNLKASNFALRLEPEQYQKVAEAASETNMSMNSFIRIAVSEKLSRNDHLDLLITEHNRSQDDGR